jgi:predicted DNA-binding protein with PD1-like motif
MQFSPITQESVQETFSELAKVLQNKEIGVAMVALAHLVATLTREYVAEESHDTAIRMFVTNITLSLETQH